MKLKRKGEAIGEIRRKHLIPLRMLKQTDDLTDFDILDTTKETVSATGSGRYAKPPNRLIVHV